MTSRRPRPLHRTRLRQTDETRDKELGGASDWRYGRAEEAASRVGTIVRRNVFSGWSRVVFSTQSARTWHFTARAVLPPAHAHAHVILSITRSGFAYSGCS
ncbi:hypothetical protein FOIG_16944 [Fusarium odoratissimum NRRL 54006]|uniref:Uncharacterized protein n=1 Tax=Fusarium odoratissimum (strain NRRL 54006) TaxID=1089451 RepID=X0ILN6_FUSO5|nr:uncharacterized protein FOIG_16944 [Fusarium odoratissimum NRRL 54006]EXL89772.1 hypothetical protein FOIG_16944 [Fusarium odoratissimum NRRL 54006]